MEGLRFERLRGQQSRLIGLEFGEKVNFRRTAVGVRMAKLDSLWSDGFFLGYRSVSGEIVVGTEQRVQDANSSTQGARTPLAETEHGIWLEECRGKPRPV